MNAYVPSRLALIELLHWLCCLREHCKWTFTEVMTDSPQSCCAKQKMITGPSAKQVYCNYVSLREIPHIPKGWTCLLQLPERDTRTRVCDLCIMHIMATELNLEISFEASLLYLYKKSTIKNYHIKLRLDIIHVCLSDKSSKIWRGHIAKPNQQTAKSKRLIQLNVNKMFILFSFLFTLYCKYYCSLSNVWYVTLIVMHFLFDHSVS